MSDLGVVAIGRNEGERLRRCLLSLARVGQGVASVYVDSGSTDGSVELARSMGVEVVELDMTRPFSAARARNAGFERLEEIAPAVEYVMFLDGDCEVADGWLDRAQAELEARPKAAVVCGRRRELFPEHSVYNRLADLEWDTPIGEAIACGGDSVIRAEAFEAVGGYRPDRRGRRGARALPAAPQGRLVGLAGRRRDDPARPGDDPVPPVVAAPVSGAATTASTSSTRFPGEDRLFGTGPETFEALGDRLALDPDRRGSRRLADRRAGPRPRSPAAWSCSGSCSRCSGSRSRSAGGSTAPARRSPMAS